jgi:two-component system CheB/CheR fusion protein
MPSVRVQHALRDSKTHLSSIIRSDLRDVAERERHVAEIVQLNALFNCAHAFIRQGGGRILSWTSGATALYGWTAEEALGQVSHELLATEFPMPLEKIETVLQRAGQWEGELVRRRRDGSQIVVASHWALRRDRAGAPTIIEVDNDITAIKRAERALKEAHRRKDEFLAMLGHELRNPLAAVRNAAGILKLPTPRAGDLSRAAAIIDRQVDHLTRLVNDLLDVARITNGTITLRKEQVPIDRVIAAAIETARPLIDARKQQLISSLPDEPLWVEGDPIRLSQVFSNLLNNAAKYTDEGECIWLTVNQAGQEITVSIRDNGVGIAPDMLPRVFDLFAQAARSLDRSQGGLGIGLTLVRSLVEMHGGRIEASSPGAGRGSEFIVQLPIVPEAQTARPRHEAAAPLRTSWI